MDKENFKPETVNKIIYLFLQDKQKSKVINSEALKLLSELIRVFVAEAAARAGQQAEVESFSVVNVDHLEKILPQLLLDF